MPIQPIIKKSTLDKFYSKSEVAEECLNRLFRYVNSDYLFLEPSAGDGAFYNLLPNKKIGYEIDQTCTLSGIIIQDFLTVTELNFSPEKVVIVGNPPFGNRNNLTNAFIKKSIELADTIAFILPNVYGKETMQKIFPKEFSLVEHIKLPENSFLLDGKEYHVPCCFQIWIKNHPINLRESIKIKSVTTDFNFNNDGTYFIFGAAPTKIISRDLVTKNNRGYYIDFETPEIMNKFKAINWNNFALSSVNGNSCWFTKQMIIEVYVNEIAK